MILRTAFFFLIFIYLINSQLPVQNQVAFDSIPECDADFALHAIALIQAKLADFQRLQQVEAILASCNKPMLQKISEASIRLLHKGIIPTQLTEQLQLLAQTKKKIKREKFNKLEDEAPPQYKDIIHYISIISTNDSLSGNEKLLYIQEKLVGLRVEERQELRRLMGEQPNITTPSSIPVIHMVVPAPTIIPPPFLPNIPPSSVPITKIESPFRPSETLAKVNVSIPPSFTIGGENENLLFTNKRNFEERPQLPLRQEEVPSAFIKTIPDVKELPSRSINLETATASAWGSPISAQVLTQGKPATNGEDTDLLKSRNNIWAEAARFLDQNTNIPTQIRKFLEQSGLKDTIFKGNPHLLAGLNVPANTFPLPTGVQEQLSKLYNDNSEDRRYLPVRKRDVIIPVVRYGGLNRFDTHTGRFDKVGAPNTKEVFGQVPQGEIRVGVIPPSRPLPRPTATLPPALTINETTTPVIFLGDGYVQVPGRAIGFGQLPTYAPAPRIPERITTTTITPGIRIVTEPLVVVDKYPSFPSIDLPTDPKQPKDFVPYRGPEEITGSNRYPKEMYNVQSGGRTRFVKIDVLNEH